jgi:hypothetical protein
MLPKTTSLCFLLLCPLYLHLAQAQPLTRRATLELRPPPDRTAWESPVQTVPLSEIEPFLSFFVVWEGSGEGMEVRFSSDGKGWSPWQLLPRDLHNPDIRITEPFFAEADRRYFQLRYQEMTAKSITCHFYNPAKTPFKKAPKGRGGGTTENCEQPPIITRSEWCPGNNCPEASSPLSTQVTHMIVHHSAGTNNAEDWAAIVRAIWDLHVNGNGWSDIGYNFLIDPNGEVYQGRGDNILGAHFCSRNSGTMGVCVIGNFQSRPPSEAALHSLVDLLAWKAFERNIDPTGWSYHPSSELDLFHISGHRDGCATACPGDQFYPMLPELRLSVGEAVNICQGVTAVEPDSRHPRSTSLKLFPNPVQNNLRLDLESEEKGELMIEVYSIDGRRQALFIHDKPTKKIIFNLPLPELAAGHYLLRLQINGQRAYGRFVKLE